MILDTLITDRTQTDADLAVRLEAGEYDEFTQDEKDLYDAGLKGAYKAADMNRVGQAVLFLETYLNGVQAALDAHRALYGVAPDSAFDVTWGPLSLTVKIDWTDADEPTPAQLTAYLQNVDDVTSCITITRQLPSGIDNLTIQGANEIERVLIAEYEAGLDFEALKKQMIENTAAIFIRSGEYNSGAAFHLKECGVRYQRVEYLISTRGITISGTKLNRESEIRARVYRPSSAAAQYIYQADSGSSLTTNFTAYTSAGGAATGYWRFGSTAASLAVATGAWRETKQNKSGIWIDGTKVATYSSVNAFTTNNSLTIHGTAASANMRIAWLERWENGVYAASYLPVHDLFTDKYGYIDTSDGKFYTNDDAVITAGGEI